MVSTASIDTCAGKFRAELRSEASLGSSNAWPPSFLEHVSGSDDACRGAWFDLSIFCGAVATSISKNTRVSFGLRGFTLACLAVSRFCRENTSTNSRGPLAFLPVGKILEAKSHLKWHCLAPRAPFDGFLGSCDKEDTEEKPSGIIYRNFCSLFFHFCAPNSARGGGQKKSKQESNATSTHVPRDTDVPAQNPRSAKPKQESNAPSTLASEDIAAPAPNP